MELVALQEQKREGLYLGALDDDALPLLLKIGNKKRVAQKVFIEYEKKSLKSHLKNADKMFYQKTCIIGENELKNGTIWVKDLENKEECEIPLKEF